MAHKLIFRNILLILIIISFLFKAIYAENNSLDNNLCDSSISYHAQDIGFSSQKRVTRFEQLLKKTKLTVANFEKKLVASKKEGTSYSSNMQSRAKLEISQIELQLEDLKLEQDILKHDVGNLDNGSQNIKLLINNSDKIKQDKKSLILINENIELTTKLLDYSKAYYSQVSKNIDYQSTSKKVSNYKTQENELNDKIENLKHKILELNAAEHNLEIKYNNSPNFNNSNNPISIEIDKIQNEVFDNDSQLGIYKISLDTLRIRNNLSQLYLEYDSGLQETNIQKKYLDRIKSINEDYVKTEDYFYKKTKLISDEVLILDQSLKLKNSKDKILILKNKLERANYYLKQYNNEKNNLLELREKIQKQYNNNLSVLQKGIWVRQKLPNNSFEWKLLYFDMLKLPHMLFLKVTDVYKSFQERVSIQHDNFSTSSVFNWLSILGIWLSITFVLKKYISKQVRSTNKDKLKYHSKILYVFRIIFSKNIVFTSMLVLVNFIFYMSDISFVTISLLLSLGGVYLFCSVVLQIAKFFLIEHKNYDKSSKQYIKYKKIYRFLLFSISIIGFFISLLTLTYYLDANYYLTVFIERLFMFCLLGFSIPLLKYWKLIPEVVQKNILSKKEYLRKSIIFFSFLLPVTVFTNSVLGFLGYVNLAWKIATAELQIIAILSIWFITRGLLKDLMSFVSDYFVKEVANGWLWSQAILKPLHKLLKVLLFFGVGFVFFFIYGWFTEAQVLSIIISFLDYTWIDIGQVIINTKSILIFIIVVMVSVWWTFWSREFAYRWLYAKVQDLSIRNSLSVFTQYTVLLISVLIILQILGIGLATLTVAFGGVLVVIGFGAKDISSNLFSGLMLLLERHVRVGDFICVGEHEGKVTKIGMRSFTLQTWDNMEVIVPNSETITKSLKNLTYNDSIVRNSFLIRVAYEEKVEHVRDVILSALVENKDVLKIPEPSVLLEEFLENAIIFRVYYYVDLQRTPLRPKVKSSVMVDVTKVLEQAKIKIPYPKQVINFMEDKSFTKNKEMNKDDDK
tara:strand:+ start:5556 stop:8624 length:3069 start_codon:yes stop_codon:yes gene_type:complete